MVLNYTAGMLSISGTDSLLLLDGSSKTAWSLNANNRANSSAVHGGGPTPVRQTCVARREQWRHPVVVVPPPVQHLDHQVSCMSSGSLVQSSMIVVEVVYIGFGWFSAT
jgi:hypothetical protein